MKVSALVIGSVFGGEEVPGQNGWHVGCRIETPNKPAFAFVDEGDLYFTSFQAVGSDHVYRIKDFKGAAARCEKDVEIETLYERTFPWPNSVQRVPDSIFKDDNKWYSVSAGFFPTNVNDGCIGLFNGDATKPSDTTVFMTPGCNHPQGEHDPFFYHKVEWVDMDGDGDLDMVTARVINDGPIDPVDQDLLWFENTHKPTTVRPWPMHRVAAPNKADVFFDVGMLPKFDGSAGTQKVIAVGSFYGQELTLVWSEDPNDNWKNEAMQKSVTIDTAGWYFDVEFHDINKNRDLDLFASTWSRSGENGKTIAYERIGTDWRKPESWATREIYTRFPTFANAGFGSPGGFDFAKLGDDDTSRREHIFVSGDDDGQLYVQSSLSDSTWRYETTSIYMTDDNIGYLTLTGATIGEIVAEDFTGDGKTDVLIPNYTRNEIIILEQDAAKN